VAAKLTGVTSSLEKGLTGVTSPLKNKYAREEIINQIGIIKANLKLKPRSQSMSRQMTQSEQIIWFNLLSKRQLLGYKFTKQKILFNYIVDFYCSELLLAIEIDGQGHDNKQAYDKVRTDFINSIGIEVTRFSNQEVINNLEGVKAYLQNYIQTKQI